MRPRRILVAEPSIGLLLAALAAAIVLLVGHRTEAQTSTASPLGVYGQTSTYCGSGAIPQNAATIPWIGCFSLSAGHRATGTFSNHNVDVSVDIAGNEVFSVDGTVVVEKTRDPPRHGRETNIPYVHPDGVDGYSICPDESPGSCPSHIDVFSRNADKSVLFMVAECFPPLYRSCVLTQKNWDFETSRQASNQGQANPPPRNPRVPMPSGPFASWPLETRGPALQTVRFACLFVAGMSFAGPSVPKMSHEAMADVLGAIVSGCVADAMPEDWPERDAELERESTYKEKVKEILPASLDLDTIAKQIAEAVKRQRPGATP
jgi:hypothetical protein